ncbi:ral guanine nucleotide dissociation stimulator-like isoform X1 [Canis lupus familiaris]|uniref:ral guanine nucleotide dissociation stimulator-like isoform X1 n=1 Tax=Canis lupus familiaris TaxID=9615 RepID=UPI0018F7074E|nr:ral guanine nucleotide dissociation stimulator-like isoform X1 [Canis lupus familiaris]
MAERASALRRNRIFPTTPSRRELLEQQVEELVPALLCLDDLSIVQFMETYPEFGTTEEILDLLFAKYGCNKYLNDDIVGSVEQCKVAISCILDIWLEYYQEDFHQPPEFLFLRKLLAFMGLNRPGSDLENRAQRYLERFSYLELVELDDEDEEDWGWPSLRQGGPHRPNLHAAGPGAVGRLTPHSHGLQSGETSQGSCTHTR